MYSCKLGSFALILALSVSHHFILLQCQEPTEPPPPPPSENSTVYKNVTAPVIVVGSSPSPPPPEKATRHKNATVIVVGSPENSTDPPTPPPPQIGLIAGVVSGSVALIVVALCACFFVRRHPPQPSTGASPYTVRVHGPKIFTYEQLYSATDRFLESNILGRGGFGTVYRGLLPDAADADDNNNKIVAIKKLNPGAITTHGRQGLITELKTVSRVYHRHIVSLVGYFSDEAQAHPECPLMLVYEFISNNSLDFHLHERGTEPIPWETRMKIAIGSAKGFQYLHEGCQPKIIHRDIKPPNILLDDHFNPKIADFGLAQLLSDSQTHVSNSQVIGTIGYFAPEYREDGKISEKSDVFAFGVVLLELVTGRKPRGRINEEFVNWARPLLSKALATRNFRQLADAKLQNDYVGEEMFRMVSCAAHCIRHSPTSRPLMSQVADALEGKITLDNGDEVTGNLE